MIQKISSFQAILLVMSSIIPTAILTVPSIVVQASGQDAWISIALATAIGIGVAYMTGQICRQTPSSSVSFVDWLSLRLGTWAGTGTGFLLGYYYFITALIIIREFVNFLAENVLTRTPVFALLLVTIAVAMYAVSCGIEVIARINIIVFMMSIVVLFITTILVLKDIHPEFLLPVWEHPISTIVQGGFIPSSWLSEVSVLLILAPFLNRSAEAGRIGSWGIILTGFELGLIVVSAVTLFGPRLVSLMSYPTFNVISIIRLGSFLERIDILFISIWICLMYVKISIFMFCALHCFIRTFRVRNEKPFSFALALFALLSTYYFWPRSSDFIHFTMYPLTPFILTFNVLLPLLIWLALSLFKPKAMEGGKLP
ncbi:GerAB/ArcD/ProY family transporter [Paenibacillus sp. OAS669]|uniref:GerAB/ArcD/ProY family transporter n=1 Tax=Paenibacillus sp. OAS669 TaxID=2663821 RepID=UPI00178B7B69|nr:endospore germination permease [Paenibacillus sp. OAS669]MBE1441682.1 spore germination protein KB [Paenibacillus sp. OAS669]